MSVPLSKYRELLTEVRTLTKDAIEFQQVISPLLELNVNETFLYSMNNSENSGFGWNNTSRSPTAPISPDPLIAPSLDFKAFDPKVLGSSNNVLAKLLGWPTKEEVNGHEIKEQNEKKSAPGTPVSSEDTEKSPEECNVWRSVEGMSLNQLNSTSSSRSVQDESIRNSSHQQLGAKVEMVYNLLAMLGSHDREQMTSTLLTMSNSPESCQAMRQSGCVQLLVQLAHDRDESPSVRQQANLALQNLVIYHKDDKRSRREARVLRLIQQVIKFCDDPPEINESNINISEPSEDPHPCIEIAALMKLSFDQEHRHAMVYLGALHAIAKLIQVDADAHGIKTNNQSCITIRRYAGMALTNLTFNDGDNKALLCSLRWFMDTIIGQLSSPSEELRQVTASIFRNLSWLADDKSKLLLSEAGVSGALMRAAMEAKKESNLKSTFSALWNLSAHNNINKMEICSVEGAIQYLVEMLSFQTPTKSLSIVESAGGVLRNVSSQIAVRDDLRKILRELNVLPFLLQQLKSPSLTIVSNACGTLWNLSSSCPQDQKTLWDLGAVPMLRSLVHSKHRMISSGATAALRNLLSCRPDVDILDPASKGKATLLVRKRRALEHELDTSLSETCENIDMPERWDSHESITSTHSENIFNRSTRFNCQRSGSLQLLKRNGNVTSSGNTVNNIEISKEQLLNCKPITIKKIDCIKEDKVDKQNDCNIENIDSKAKEDFLVNNFKQLSLDEPNQNNQNAKNNSPKDNLSNNSQRKPDEPKQSNVEELDMPTNFSLKYPEVESKAHDFKLMDQYGEHSENDIEPTENDLDQPTDYSLKYREPDAGGIYDEQQVLIVEESPTKLSSDNYSSDTTTVIYNNGYAETDLDDPNFYLDDSVETYCTEGTPFTVSSATSMTDIRIAESEGQFKMHKSNDKIQESLLETIQDSDSPKAMSTNLKIKDCKSITNETPMMLSRSSSPDSLSSIEQQDAGSPISEFSRLASGAISPSELPDSPTNSAPPTPKDLKARFTIPRPNANNNQVRVIPQAVVNPLPPVSGAETPKSINSNMIDSGKYTPEISAQKNVSNLEIISTNVSNKSGDNTSAAVSNNVFDDTVAEFKEESTPFNFSKCTSLSSLTFDDEVDQSEICLKKFENDKKASPEKDLSTVSEDDVGEEDDGEDDMLAACINMGMQQSTSNRDQEKQSPTKFSHLGSRLPKPKFSGIPIKFHSSELANTNLNKKHGNIPGHTSSSKMFNEDYIKEFKTEDTPASFSHATSHSDLSNICGSVLSDDGSSDHELMLAECIRSAIPTSKTQVLKEEKSKKLTKRISTSSYNNSTTKETSPLIHTRLHFRVNDLKGNNIQDETACFATEGSPGIFSTRSSLSDLTINSGLKNQERNRKNTNRDDFGASPLSSLEPEVSVLTHQPSTSSLSDECNEDNYLIEQCILSGLPKPKNTLTSVGAPGEAPTDVNQGKSIPAPIPSETVVAFNGIISSVPIDKNDSLPAIPAQIPIAAATIIKKNVSAEPKGEINKELHQPFKNLTEEQQLIDRGITDPMQASADTWNEMSSPNDISFPSLTAPLISSYKSNMGEDDKSLKCLDDHSLNDSIIPLDEGKIGFISNTDMESSFMSDLELVRPPSAMGSLLSLTTSISEADKMKDKMKSIVARRAICDSSLSWNNIESIKPPSAMDELLDLENSILSVASITSEVADLSDNTLEFAPPHSYTNENEAASKLSSSPQRNRTPKMQRRQHDKDRYRTYTINSDDIPNGFSNDNSLTEVPAIDNECDEVTISNDELPINEESVPKKNIQKVNPKQRRLADKDRYRTRVLGINCDLSTNNISSPSPSPGVIETNDESESGDLIACSFNFKTYSSSVGSLESDGESQSQEEELEVVEKGKPRVVKPILTNASAAANSTSTKVVRGKKKVIQSSIPIIASSKPSTPVRSLSTPSTTTTSPAATPPPLQRQGTFTKDDVSSSTPSSIPVFKKGSPAKTVKKISTPQNKTPTNATTPAMRKLAGRGRAGSLPRTEPAKKPAVGVRTSVSNQSLKSESMGSNSSLGSTTSRCNSNSNLTSLKKDTTSKIASLWKKVENSKRKETTAKDTRVWITPANAPHSKQIA